MKHASRLESAQRAPERARPSAGRARRRIARWTIVGVVVLFLSVLIGLFAGAIRIPPLGILGWMVGDGSLTEQQRAILAQLRLPRVVLAGLVGAALSVSGCAYQAAFRNPLADPYLLGSAAGAGLGATMVIVLGLTDAPFALPAAAFAGALGGVGLAYLMASTRAAGRTSTSLLLAGVAVASFLTALQTYVQQRDTDDLRAVYAFILGRLGTGGWHEVLLALPWVLLASAVLLASRRLLEVLSLGDLEAASLGAHVARDRAIVVIAASLATAAAVAVAGLIGFVGLIVPHAVRMATGASHRQVVGLSLLFGASFLILCDVLARTVVAPGELPIGVITAMIGAPFFAIVLRRAGGAR
jgi:iron complex transport system permease protein